MDSGSLYKIAHSELDDGAEPHASLFVSLSRNRTGALSPNSRNGALRQFVSKACSATPELAFLADMFLTSVLQQPEEARWSRRAAALLIIYHQHLASCQVHKVDDPTGEANHCLIRHAPVCWDFVGKPTLHV
jgi:hypothetical protein